VVVGKFVCFLDFWVWVTSSFLLIVIGVLMICDFCDFVVFGLV